MYGERWYQTEAEQSIFDYYGSGKQGNPIVALPTGTGKSLVISNFTKRAIMTFPQTRIVMLTHAQKLIEQNAKRLLSVWDTAPLGIYSAGLNRRESNLPVIFGGIQSVCKNPALLGHRDLMLVDECHLISQNGNSQYQKTIGALKAINPYLRVIGFTATKYRMGQGLLTDGGLFTDTCYDLTDVDSFNRLVAEGYLAPLITKKTNVEVDTKNIHVVKGEFNAKETQEAVDKILYEAIGECIQWGWNRRAWLVFADGVANADKIAAMLNDCGITAVSVHSKLPKDRGPDGRTEVDRRIDAFTSGAVQCIVNADMLTTGFDHPAIDMIVMLRPTMSTPLWVQMLGRGTRPFPEGGKLNCFVLDFAGNTKRIGPINDPILPRKPGQGGGDAPIRICPNCNFYNHASARQCVNCGQEFKFETKIFGSAGSDEVMRNDSQAVIEYYDVKQVLYNMHIKRDANGVPLGAPSMKVTYICGLKMVNEWVSFESPNAYVQRRASEWWRSRDSLDHEGNVKPIPATTNEALQRSPQLRWPRRIRCELNGKYPTILGCEY